MPALAFVFLCLACSGPKNGGAQPGGGDGGSAADAGNEFTGPQIDVQPVLDSANAQRAAIDEQGGTLTATGAGGTVFRLDIPAGALDGRTVISLTPISSIGGLPLHGPLRAAVQLHPDGLRFITPATLTMTPSASFSSAAMIGLTYHGSGTELHRYPSAVDGAAISFQLLHFTGVIAAERSGPQDDIAPLVPAAEAIAEQRLARLKESGNALPADYSAVFLQWYDQHLKPELVAAGTDESFLESALDSYESFLMWEQITLQDNGALLATQILEAKALIEAAALRAVDRYLAKCLNHDVASGFSILRIVLRMNQTHVLAPNSQVSNAAQAALGRCLNFKLEFDSTILWNSVQAKTHAQVTTKQTAVPLAADLTGFPQSVRVRGSAQLLAVPMAVSDPPCKVSEDSWNQPTLNVVINFSGGASASNAVSAPNLYVKISGSDFNVTETTTCPGEPSATTTTERFWQYFGVFHVDEKHGTAFYIVNWAIQGGEIYALKQYASRTMPGPQPPSDAILNETTTLTVHHAPK
jgi:hypothetical protein